MYVVSVVVDDLAHDVDFDVQREFHLSLASMKKLAACMMVIRLASMRLDSLLSARKEKLRLTLSRKDKNW